MTIVCSSLLLDGGLRDGQRFEASRRLERSEREGGNQVERQRFHHQGHCPRVKTGARMQFRLVKIFLLDFYFLNRFFSNSLSSSIKNLVSTE